MTPTAPPTAAPARAAALPLVVPLRPRRTDQARAVQQLLPLQWSTGGLLQPAPARTRYRVVRNHGTHLVPASADPGGSGDRPEPGAWAGGLVQLVLDVMNGDRPLHQLMRWLDVTVYHDLATATATARGRAGRKVGATTVRSVHLCELSDHVVEASVMVSGRGRARATAIRLEGSADRWRCTRLAFL